MERLSIALTALAALFLLSCGKSPSEKAIEFFNSYAEKMENVKTADEVNAVAEAFDKEIYDIIKYESKYTPEEMAAVAEAQMRYETASSDAYMKFAEELGIDEGIIEEETGNPDSIKNEPAEGTAVPEK